MRSSDSGIDFRVSSSVDQMTCSTFGVLRRLRHVARLTQLLLGLHVVPEERHAESAVRILERFLQALHIVDVTLHHLGAQLGERLCFVGVDVPRDGTRGKWPVLVFQNGAHQSPALSSRRTHHRDYFLVHYYNPLEKKGLNRPDSCLTSCVWNRICFQ